MRVGGFKSLRKEQHIAIRPLTVIAGVNSSGKSSVIQPLLLLKQTLEAPYDPGPLLLDGPNVSVTQIEQILWRNSSGKQASKHFTVGFGLGGSPEVVLRFGRGRSGDLRLLNVTGPMAGGTIATINESMSEKELAEAVPQQIKATISEGMPQLAKTGIRWKVARDRWSLNVHLVFGTGLNAIELPMGPILDQYENEIGRIIHLPALRGNPKRNYRTAAVEENYPGTFNDYTAGIITAWQNRSQTDKLEQLRSDLEPMSLTVG